MILPEVLLRVGELGQRVRHSSDRVTEHLDVMRRLGNACQVIVVHGRDDTTCPFAEAEELVALMAQSGLGVEPRFIGKSELDGVAFTSAGHALGNRTKIVFRVGDRYLLPNAPTARVRPGKSDFDLRDSKVRFRTSRGEYVVVDGCADPSECEYDVDKCPPAPAPGTACNDGYPNTINDKIQNDGQCVGELQ